MLEFKYAVWWKKPTFGIFIFQLLFGKLHIFFHQIPFHLCMTSLIKSQWMFMSTTFYLYLSILQRKIKFNLNIWIQLHGAMKTRNTCWFHQNAFSVRLWPHFKRGYNAIFHQFSPLNENICNIIVFVTIIPYFLTYKYGDAVRFLTIHFFLSFTSNIRMFD